MTLPRWEIPDCWQWVDAGEVAQIVGGGTPPSKDEANFSEDGIPWIGPADLTGYREVYISHGRRSLSEQGYARSGATLMPAGAVLFSSRAPIGYCAIAANPISTNQGFKSWVCDTGIVPEFVRYYLLASVEYVDSLASGTTFREISGKRVEAIAFPLPPEAEQRRIVAKLDALTARLARARAELDRVPVLAADLKQSSLDAAFSGTPAEQCTLLDAVNEDRGICYGVVQTGEPIGGGVPTVRGGDIKRFSIKRDILKQIDPKIAQAYRRTFLRGGEVVISIRGTIGNPAVVRDELAGCNISREVALIPVNEDWDPDFIAYLLSCTASKRFLTAHTKGTAQPGINLIDLRRLSVPLCPRDQQQEIVTKIRAAFARADRLEAEAARARVLLDRLESALLAKAFRGELVPQDPNDEPAETLLARIRAERAAAPKAKRGRKAKVAM